ncbi:FAD:protein FMN transferase [Marinigracilibium pacificum]|uniref:FAD:protein FMN transferase n=1 Tax=Marinigracilibium pacificum TaxID=2729599 RepID=A0A848IYY7_9BACT|nr:FAD:protein FMN transferase [Marinigracilibium pacificum]NMM49743.1 FAD:protein FMN transferase [Marinigracilibium pacificum]
MINNRIKNAIYTVVLLLSIFLVHQCRNQNQPESETKLIAVTGKTMGTYYSIKYLDSLDRNFKPIIDSTLEVFNQSLSTYIPDSEISIFNRNDSLTFNLPFFYPVLKRSEEIFAKTNGAFDPTVMPLVRLWGFGPDKKSEVDSAIISETLTKVGFDKITYNQDYIKKLTKGVELDFSAIAKGYGVDVISDLLSKNGINNYLVEIGGEVRVNGLNHEGQAWSIGIDKPEENTSQAKKMSAIVQLSNKAMATSGNYRNFYVKDGIKYAHTISPKTGYPIFHKLLSASVISDNCMSADAYATSFMVSGLETSKQIAEKEGLEVILIYSDDEGNYHTYISPSLESKIKLIN